jgi:hypothetical protein
MGAIHSPTFLLKNGVGPARELKEVGVEVQEDREAVAFFYGPNAFGGPFILPPGVPEARVALLRKAFAEVFADPEAAAQALRLNIDRAPLAGEEVQQRVQMIMRPRRRSSLG